MDGNLAPSPSVYIDRDMDRCETVAIGGGLVAVLSARCPTKETANEDAAVLLRSGSACGVLAVADGMGGGPSGEQASSLVLRALSDAVARRAGDDGLLRTAVLDGLEAANAAVAELGNGAATTVAAVELRDRTVRPYHVGDSLILVVGQRGKIKLLTTSHSPVGFAVEAGVLNEQEAMFHHDRHIVSNVVGCPRMKIELGPVVRLAPRDTLLLASDGLFDNLHTAEIVERIRKGPLAKCGDRLFRDARQRMLAPADGQPSKPDDLTLILFRAG